MEDKPIRRLPPLQWWQAYQFLRMEQIDPKRYFELCEENGWPKDRVPVGDELPPYETFG